MKYGLLLFSTLLMAAGADLDQARKLYNRTDFDGSLKILQALPEKSPEVNLWIGKSLYMLGEYKKSTEVLEKAVEGAPASSEAYLWLGRAWGRRAETSSVLTAPGHASKARQNFEKAVQLGPRNLEAMSDLFEYYLEAPGFLGGGFDKAQALAARMAEIDPAEGFWAQAKLDEDRKQFSSAEEHLRRAVEASPQQVGRIFDLARFFMKRGRYQEANQSIAKAEKIAPDAPRLLFIKADLYIQQHTNLETARELLKRYLSSTLTPDDPPRSAAEKLLRQTQGG